MNKEQLVIINNEKVFHEKKKFFCDNFGIKIVSEELNDFFDVRFLVRNSKKKGGQKINLKNIKISSNIFQFIYYLLRTFKDNPKYLIISITPYTFIARLLLFFFRKKVYLYLWSKGHEEWEHLVGKWSVWIFHLMYLISTYKSKLIVCNKRLTEKKSNLISISRLEDSWFQNQTKANLNYVNFLYVGRISKEKGIFDLVNMFEKFQTRSKLSIAGYAKNFKSNNPNIKLLGYLSNPKILMKAYDDHNITILPSYTEGYGYVVDESLARKRPVIIFEEIKYIKNNKNGIFVIKRNFESLNKTANYIIENYSVIQSEIEKNDLPTKKNMIKQIVDIIKD